LNSKQQTLYAIGRIGKAFGVRGEVVVHVMTPSAARFKKLKHVHVGLTAEEARLVAIESARVDERGVRIRFVGMPDRTSVERLKDNLIFVDENELLRPKKGSYFIHEMIGLKVLNESNDEVGVVKDVLRLPAQDVYVVESEGREWMLPAVKEFIRSIDVAGKILRVRLIEGMMET
jgi:16S rRNA processing protein RimM